MYYTKACCSLHSSAVFALLLPLLLLQQHAVLLHCETVQAQFGYRTAGQIAPKLSVLKIQTLA
jgi:hypothetical protein